MALSDWVFDQKQRARRLVGLPIFSGIDPFRLATADRERLKLQAQNELEKIFYLHRGRIAHKWIHYLAAYDRHFAPYRGEPVKVLEIGVSEGGSLEMWREYFGVAATIFGIDIDPACAQRVTAPNQVRIGSQTDGAFLQTVVAEMGTPDIIIDDGSHVAKHQLATFRTLFPVLKSGGVYVIEDLHTAYWPGCHGGGHGRRDTAIGLVKQIIDDMHAWYHDKDVRTPAKDEITGVHMYDSIVFLEKGAKERPGCLQVS